MRGVLFYNSSNGEGATAQLQSLHDHGPTERDGSAERKVMMRHLAVPVAMAIFAGTMIGSAGPAQANKIQYAGVAYGQLEPSDELVAPGLPDYPTMYVQVDFITSESGASVRATNVHFHNGTGRALVVNVDRWQAADGSPVYRGVGGVIPAWLSEYDLWSPEDYIPFEEDPYVHVHVYAQSRPGIGADFIILAKPIRNTGQ